MTSRRRPEDDLPDVRDGLTRVERIILHELAKLQAERGGANVPTTMLYGRVVERIDLGVDELQATLGRLITANPPPRTPPRRRRSR